MKVVLLESGRGNRAGVIAGWREKIGLADDDSITLLSWYPPREALPVDLHVVFGPKMRVRTKARSGQVLLDEIRRIRIAEEKRRREEGLDLDGAYDEDDDGAQDEDDLAGQLPESMLGATGTTGTTAKATPRDPAQPSSRSTSSQAATSNPATSNPATSNPATSNPATSNPATSNQATSTQAAEAVAEIIETAADQSPADDAPAAALTETPASSATQNVSSQQYKPTPRRTGLDADELSNDVLSLPKHHPERINAALRWRARKVYHTAKASYPVRKGRAGLRRAIGGISSEFALALAGWKGAPVVVGNADLVLSLDSRSQKAAWVLARRVHGPAVVVSYPAAARVLRQRRAEAD